LDKRSGSIPEDRLSGGVSDTKDPHGIETILLNRLLEQVFSGLFRTWLTRNVAELTRSAAAA